MSNASIEKLGVPEMRRDFAFKGLYPAQVRIKVRLVSRFFFPEYSGAAIRFQRYAPMLRERGIDLSVLTCSDNARHTSAEAVLEGRHSFVKDTVDNISVTRVLLPKGTSREKASWALGRSVTAETTASRELDLIHFLTLTFASVPWLWKIRAAGVPVIYSATLMRNPDIGAVRNVFAHCPLKYVDCIVANSSSLERQLQQAGVRTRIEVIPNGVDLDRYRPCEGPDERNRLRRELDLPTEAEVVLFVGEFLSQRKGADLVLEAWKRVAAERPAAILVLVGPEARRRERQGNVTPGSATLASFAGDQERICMTGRVENVGKYLRAADVFVFPSRREGMPNVVLEAFASGLPSVLCPFLGISRELGRPGKEYELVEHDPEQIASSVTQLLADRTRSRDLGTSARVWVERELGQERCLDAYTRLYAEISRLRRGRSP